MRGRLHRHQRQQLQHMVLHHVADCARIIIERDAAFQPDGFGHGDLHVINMRCIPQRFEHQIGKAQRQQVLHRLLAKIVIDPENAVFGEGGGDCVIDFAAGDEIGAERFFKAHPHIIACQPGGLQPLDGGFKQARRGREEDRQPARRGADPGGKIAVTFKRGRIERLVAEAVEEIRHPPAPVSGEVFLQRCAREAAIFAAGQLAARGADDLEVIGQQAIGIEREQAGQQHPLGKVARGSEQQQAVSGEAHAGRPFS